MLKKEKKDRKGFKPAVNRKLLIWIFGLTGLLSLFFWWRGRVIRGGDGIIDLSGGEIRWVIEPSGDGLNSGNTELLIQQIEKLTATASGMYAVYVQRLDDGTTYGINQSEEMPGVSIMKLPVIITAISKIENGELKFTDKYTLEEADRTSGSGPLQFKQAGTSYSIDELLTYLGKNSDNTAWVMFNRRFGKKTIQETMDRLGMISSHYDQLTTTATDVAKMWKYLYDGQITNSNRKKIWNYLTESIYEDRIPAGLAETQAEIVGHKVGTDADVWADAGIVKHQEKSFVLVILNKGVIRTEAEEIVPKMAKTVLDFENSL